MVSSLDVNIRIIGNKFYIQFILRPQNFVVTPKFFIIYVGYFGSNQNLNFVV